MGVRWVDEEGSRWRVGDSFPRNVWEAKWIPRPSTFKIVTPHNPQFSLLMVGDLVDSDQGTWRGEGGHDKGDFSFG